MKRIFLGSAFKHGFTECDVDEVLSIRNPSTKDWNQGFGELGERVLFVGYNSQAELLEVIVEYKEAPNLDEMIIFHIDKASKENQKRFVSE